MINLLKKSFLLTFISLASYQCAKVDPVTGEKIIINPNPKEKAEEFVKREGGLFSDITKNKGSTTFEFASSNILWRATLKSLDFLPLINADYSGGVVIYDWYSDKENSNEEIKITVNFLNNEIKADSLKISAFKKTCDVQMKCFTKKLDNNFTDNIKDTILTSARSIKIEETKKQKK
jgi:hypothetical protein